MGENNHTCAYITGSPRWVTTRVAIALEEYSCSLEIVCDIVVNPMTEQNAAAAVAAKTATQT